MTTWPRRLLLLAVLGAAGYYLATRWSQVWHTLRAVSPGDAVASQVAVFAAMIAATYGWQAVVDDMGEPVGGFRGGQIYLVGQLGKYLPGSVWAYLLQMELGRRAGVARARVFTASLVQLGISLVTALALGIAALPLIVHHMAGAVWLFALLPVGVVLLHPKVLTWGTSLVLRVLRRPPLDHPLRWATIGKVLTSAVATYLLYGLHLWLLAGSGMGAGGILLCTGAIAIGLNAGLLLFVLPSGAGLRDVVVAAVLATTLGPVRAAAFAVVSRLMFTIGDLTTAVAAAGLARWRAPLPVEGVELRTDSGADVLDAA
ncbi:MAG TPA: lysylphosphatidylglycerol synthase domain-containing protein [Pseudonocardiaceae bacterium]|nr:lysylphosphatidylglycerol synthase domain-containing protein [Pseudonocardiaceae bacterium]